MIDLTIDNLTFGGRGVGRVDGKAVFVPYTMPGEKVRCRITREHKRYSEAELDQVLVPSSARKTPACPVFTECGGCQWQHLPYDGQLQWKERIFRESLTRSSTLTPEMFLPIIASPDQWHYRCRAQIKCRLIADRFVTGFYRPASHYVVDIEYCPLLAPELNRLLPPLKEVLSGWRLASRVPQLDLAVDDKEQLLIIVHFPDRDYSGLRDLLSPLAAEFGCAVYVQTGKRKLPIELVAAPGQSINPLADDAMQLLFPPGGFVQVNLAQNRRLVADIVSQVMPRQRILDLFCGVGNFSLPLAGQADALVGVEDYAPAIETARTNARALGLENAVFHTAKAEKVLAELWRQHCFDTVILDPPRVGALAVIKQLTSYKPQQIIYVSCDPMTLGRDLKPLLDLGYRAKVIRPYDMFPQTYHIEGLVVLERTT